MLKVVRLGKTAACLHLLMALPVSISCAATALGQQPIKLTIHWDKVTAISNTTPTLQVVVNPQLRRGAPLSAASFKALKDLGADYVRYVFWLPYPRLAVAELKPPNARRTSWNFALIDPLMKDFFAATDGHPVIVNFSTIPAWMFETQNPVMYPDDPNQVDWSYTQGREPRDPTNEEIGNYYARLLSWYVRGGFTDENGVRHNSGHHYKLPWWEVLNEPGSEHSTTPEQYTERYDAIVSAIHRVSPDTKFVGLALGWPVVDPAFFSYFLDPAHHKPGIPLDMISYHFYAMPVIGESLDRWQYSVFNQEAGFLNTVRNVEAIRKRLSPHTRTDLDELGVVLRTDNRPGDHVPPPAAYWNLSGAMFADLFIELSRLQIDIVSESQLVGYPTQFPSVSMMDWTSDRPNARFWVLKLIKDSFHPSDKLVETEIFSRDVSAQAFITSGGRKLLLVNKRNRELSVALPDAVRAAALAVDEETGDNPARSVPLAAGAIPLKPFSVTVVSW